jgi:protein-L-isoaspartate O-methyltransferase
LLVAPIGPPEDQQLLRIAKNRGETRQQVLLPCRFVPLVGEFSPE